MKAGFVNIFGKPNAGKSTLLNTLLGEKLAIVTPKVQTTRHRIIGILTSPDAYQIVFSDTPGIIDETKYKLHEKMMQQVKSALEDADVALLMVDVQDDWHSCDALFLKLHLKVPAIVVINKIDTVSSEKVQQAEQFFSTRSYCQACVSVSARAGTNINLLLNTILSFLPEGQPFYNEDELTNLPVRFFVAEIIREKIYLLYEKEIPYQTAIIINEFKEHTTTIKIQADIIVQRESQKAILLGENGKKIKELGIMARKEIEEFLNQKVFLSLFVKVRPNWRNNERLLREYGYN